MSHFQDFFFQWKIHQLMYITNSNDMDIVIYHKLFIVVIFFVFSLSNSLVDVGFLTLGYTFC